MSEKQVKRARRGARLRLRWVVTDEVVDWPAVRVECEAKYGPQVTREEIELAANRTGKTFCNAGLALDDDGEVVVVDPMRLLGIEREDSE